MNVQEFKAAMARWASGVSIVSTMMNDKPVGITVTGFISLSVDPPSVLVSIDRKSYMVGAIKGAGRFSVTFLSEGQEEISRLFASNDLNKFREEWTGYKNGLPYVKGGTTVFAEVQSGSGAFDHVLYIGKVTDLILNEEKPLVYWNRMYLKLNMS
ncbi:MAG: flavin reductase family protein [Nitrososphaerota archaeon]|jgi:flavin reductase (DIM6/NTAB) family NADH-FMN oxidoreductase RutF|nr:flavin reductase family protein [Nitrososphaerota archaeon]MDG6929849.1 flavin reductase family protein [Nitrososphaerota archaeon]MDG6936367.1 flavin reductase family protein [Nitrososphaerota archaeon]